MSVLRKAVGWFYTIAGTFYGQPWMVAAGQAILARDARLEQKKEQRRAINAYNESLQDRLHMEDLLPAAPRSLVLGRVRCVEGVRRRWSSGTNEERLTLIVSFAGHEIDAFEQWYLDDVPVTLDNQGWVIEQPYRPVNVKTESVTVALTNGGGTVQLPTVVDLSSVRAVWYIPTTEPDTKPEWGVCTVVVAGLFATLSGAPTAAATAELSYSYTTDQSWWASSSEMIRSRVRIRHYTGSINQNVGAALAAEYPGKITSADRFAGIALAVVDLFYDPDVFPSGRPTVTCVIRGAKCYDPRSLQTTWTQNPALHALHYARWAHGWALTDDDIDMGAVSAAATLADAPTNFTLTMPNGSTSTVTLPRYRCGIVISSDADHAESMNAIVQTMAGRHGWSGGRWKLQAGGMQAPVTTIDQSWVVSDASTDAVVSASNTVPRSQRINRVTGSCVDPSQRHQLLPFPSVADPALISQYGERAINIAFAGVDHMAHAQYLARVAIRQAQAGLQIQITCGHQAQTLELFDTVLVTLPRYGITAKTFEVHGWTWSQQGAYQLLLQEIADDIFDLGPLTGRDPAPDSDLRLPWQVDAVTGLAVESGTEALQDGSILSRVRLTWDAVTSERIRQGGRIEIQYTLADEPVPSGEWASWTEPGDAAQAVIPGLLAGRHYLFRVRAVQPMPLVRGAWSENVMHQVAELPANSLPRHTVYWFRRSNEQPLTPTLQDPSEDEDEPWSDAPPPADLEGKPLWVSFVQVFTGTGELAGDYSDPVQIEGGSIQVEYSVDGLQETEEDEDLWHPVFVPGDRFARYRVGFGAWSASVRIVGEAAQSVSITATGQIFVTPSNSTTPAPSTLTLTANIQNITTPVYEWLVDDVVQVGQTAATFALSSFAATGNKTVRCNVTGAGGANGFDVMTIYSLKEGDDALSAGLENENRSVSCNSAGTPDGGQFPMTSTMIVARGATFLTTPAVSFSLVESSGFATPTINATTGAISIAGITADFASAKFRATVGTATIDRVFRANKVRAGADGADGANGADGGAGPRGSVTRYVSGSAWSDAAANAALPGGVPITGDEVTIYNGSTFVQFRTYNGTAWVLPGAVIDGSLLVSGTITGNKIAANTIVSASLATSISVDTDGYVHARGQTALTVDPLGVGSTRTIAVAGNTGGGAQVGVFGRTTQSGGSGVYGWAGTNGDGGTFYGNVGVVGVSTGGVGAAGGAFFGHQAGASTAVIASVNNAASGSVGIDAQANSAGQVAVKASSSSGTALQVVGAATISGQLSSTRATGAPITVTSTTVCTNLNADLLDGQHGSFYTNASNLSSGTVPSARISLSSANVTGALGYTPTQQIGGNAVKFGWGGSALNLTVDITSFGSSWPINVTGTSASAASLTSPFFTGVTVLDRGLGGVASYPTEMPTGYGNSLAKFIAVNINGVNYLLLGLPI